MERVEFKYTNDKGEEIVLSREDVTYLPQLRSLFGRFCLSVGFHPNNIRDMFDFDDWMDDSIHLNNRSNDDTEDE